MGGEKEEGEVGGSGGRGWGGEETISFPTH